MPARALAAAVVAVLTFVTAQQVRAADLYGENYNPPPDNGDYYDEAPAGACDDRGPCDDGALPPNRYSDRGAYDYGRDNYEYRGGSVKDGYPVPVPAPAPRYGEYRYGEGRYSAEAACLPRWQIKRRLREEGWVDLWPIDRDGPVVSVKARRAQSGRLFRLDIDKCTGEIVHARPEFLRTFGAYDPPPRRWYDRQPY